MAQFCIEVQTALIVQDLVIRAGNERVINLKLTILNNAYASVYVIIHHHQNDAMLYKRSFLHNGCFHFGFCHQDFADETCALCFSTFMSCSFDLNLH